MGTIYGYARVSTQHQDLQAQVNQLIGKGVSKANIYSEKFTGTTNDRPVFNELLAKLEKGDTLIVTKLDRIARNATSGAELVKGLVDKGVTVNVLNMGLADTTASGKLMIHIMTAFAEFERDMIVERTQSGKTLAKQREDFVEGRPKVYKRKQLDTAMELLESHSYKEVSEKTGISVSTLTREKRKRKALSSNIKELKADGE